MTPQPAERPPPSRGQQGPTPSAPAPRLPSGPRRPPSSATLARAERTISEKRGREDADRVCGERFLCRNWLPLCGAGKPGRHRAAPRLEIGARVAGVWGLKAEHSSRSSVLPRGGSISFSLRRPSAGCMRPTHMVEVTRLTPSLRMATSIPSRKCLHSNSYFDQSAGHHGLATMKPRSLLPFLEGRSRPVSGPHPHSSLCPNVLLPDIHVAPGYPVFPTHFLWVLPDVAS